MVKWPRGFFEETQDSQRGVGGSYYRLPSPWSLGLRLQAAGFISILDRHYPIEFDISSSLALRIVGFGNFLQQEPLYADFHNRFMENDQLRELEQNKEKDKNEENDVEVLRHVLQSIHKLQLVNNQWMPRIEHMDVFRPTSGV